MSIPSFSSLKFAKVTSAFKNLETRGLRAQLPASDVVAKRDPRSNVLDSEPNYGQGLVNVQIKHHTTIRDIYNLQEIFEGDVQNPQLLGHHQIMDQFPRSRFSSGL